ncbi:MAG: DUF2235 domain-containing protein [Roseivivax sp.]|nr:DUF2235 domain-containing protein [Roseivivax sp.]
MDPDTSWRDRLLGWVHKRFSSSQSPLSKRRGPRDHVIILDGTMSSLRPGRQTNAGQTYLLLKEVPGLSLFYEAGVQWDSWSATPDVMMGRGINMQICRAYGYLASRYHAGDRVFLLGYSRGAFAVRSLGGIIDRVGLLHTDAATERNIRQVYRLYQIDPDGDAARAFARLYCHSSASIEMVGAWDTVKALGLRLPVLWRLTEPEHDFHNHQLGRHIRHGYHALALDETRQAYTPVMWRCPDGYDGQVEQVWFRGTHGDVGGHLDGTETSRPLANIPLVWMLERLERHGIQLPQGWRGRFPCDPDAPSMGTWNGLGRLFVLRAPRVVGADRSERIHDTVPRAEDGKPAPAE